MLVDLFPLILNYAKLFPGFINYKDREAVLKARKKLQGTTTSCKK